MHPVVSNFTVADLIGIAGAFLLFPLFTLVPGYVCGWLVDAFGFRGRSLLARLAISVPLSIGVSPILAYLSWHWSILAVWVVFGATWVGFLGLAFYERRRWFSLRTVSGRRIAFIVIVTGWVVLGTFLLMDLQFSNRLYFPLVAYDYTFRSAVTAAITNSGIPPHNPYFFPGRPFTLRYHYFWFIPCSLVGQIGGFAPRLAVIAGTLWSGIGLIALIPLYLRFFQPKGPKDLDRRMLIGVALLSVGGLNILPIALVDVFSRNLILMDVADVLPWADQVLWAPHHVAALVACLTGFLLIHYRPEPRGVKGDALAAAGAGIMFASALGLSIYVTLVLAVFMIVWLAVSAAWRHFREVGMVCASGVVALALSLPYIVELLGGSHQSASGGPLLEFAIRSFPITGALVSNWQFAERWPMIAANLLFLPPNYFLELGFFFLIAFLQWRKMRASGSFFRHPELSGFVMAASGAILCTFVRSGVIAVNDLGIRGFMVVQFILLIWGAELLDDGLIAGAVRTGKARRNLVIGTLALGAAGTVYDLGVLRSFPVIADDTNIPRHKWLSSDHDLGSRTYALRQLYENLKTKMPPTAVLQHNPDVDPGDLPYGLYADRQTAAETLNCGTVFGGDPVLCSQIMDRIRDLFEKRKALAADQVDTICKDLSIDALIVQDTDPVWADGNSWVWKKRPAIANRYARAFVCGRSGDLR